MSADLSAVAASLRTERAAKADVAQLAERVLGKDEVTSSILVIGSILRSQDADELRMASQLGCQQASGQATCPL